jgi:hypothetical protein
MSDETSDFEVKKPEFRVHEIWVRVTSTVYGRVYHASKQHGVSMSQLCALCIEKGLDDAIREAKRLNLTR